MRGSESKNPYKRREKARETRLVIFGYNAVLDHIAWITAPLGPFYIGDEFNLSEAPVLKEFDRNVFISIVEKAIAGGYDDEGNADPSMITLQTETIIYDEEFQYLSVGEKVADAFRNGMELKKTLGGGNGNGKKNHRR